MSSNYSLCEKSREDELNKKSTSPSSRDFGNLELLPARPRHKCEECGRKFAKKLIVNKRTKKKVCTQCNKRLGSNIFYSPGLIQPKNFVGKYSMSETEKKVLGNSKSKNVSKWLNDLRQKNYSDKKTDAKKELLKKQEKIDLQKRFLEGLYKK